MANLTWTYHDHQGASGFSALLDVIVNGTFAAIATKDEFTFGNGGESVVFGGQFVVDGFGQLIGGTITGFRVYEGADLLLDASGYQLALADFKSMILAVKAGDADSFFTTFLDKPLVGVGSNSLDVIVGSAFADVLSGRGSTDLISGQGGKDRISGGDGADALAGGDGKDRITGDGGNDLIKGEGGRDKLSGGPGNDMISGGNGKDRLKGGDGDDLLVGDRGNDVLFGGRGDDFFVFNDSPGAVGVDRIKDFKPGHDRIGLLQSAFEGIGDVGQVAVDAFVIGARAHDKMDRIIYDAKTGALYYDVDGKGGEAQTKIAILKTDLKLSHANFSVTDGAELLVF